MATSGVLSFGRISEFQPELESIETYEQRVRMFLQANDVTDRAVPVSTTEHHRCFQLRTPVQSVSTRETGRQDRRRAAGDIASPFHPKTSDHC